LTRESCRFLPLFPLRRGDLAIWASTRENAVKPLSRRSHSDITDAQRQCADRDSSHRDRLPFLLLLPSFRDRVTQSVLTCMNPMHRYHIVQSSVLRIDSTTIANIATICIVIGSNPLAGGRRTEESRRRLRRIVCLYGPLQSDWTTTKTASRSILSYLNVEYIYLYIYIYIYIYICTAYIHRIYQAKCGEWVSLEHERRHVDFYWRSLARAFAPRPRSCRVHSVHC